MSIGNGTAWVRPPSRLRLAAGGAAVASALSLCTCGPSVQTIYEGNVRFEHCYRLDLDNTKAPSHRHACWRSWLQLYTYAQPRDRIEYARRRVRSIEAGDADRPVLALNKERDPNDRQWYVSAPGPINAHAPPPAMAIGWDKPDAAPERAAKEVPDAGPPVPEQECTANCRTDWQTCLDGCAAPDGSVGGKSCNPCEPNYLSCMRRCFP